MARMRRKDLKRDRFVEEVSHQVEYVTGHRKQFIGAGIAVVVGLLAGVGYWTYDRQQGLESNGALQDAIELFHGQVTTEDLPGFKTFATEADRIDAVTRALDEVSLNYPRSAAATGAAYYSGLLDREENNTAEAQAHLEQAVRGKGSEYAALARLALGGLLLDQGDAEGAREQFRMLVESPTRAVTKELASIEMARTFISSDPEQAREILTPIQEENGPASAMATALMETLGEGS